LLSIVPYLSLNKSAIASLTFAYSLECERVLYLELIIKKQPQIRSLNQVIFDNDHSRYLNVDSKPRKVENS